MAQFKDRRDAGKVLARELANYTGRSDVVIFALPRGGVPVAFEVAQSLGLPLDVFVVRKLGLPDRKEIAIGAIATGGVRVLNHDVIRLLNIPKEVVNIVTKREFQELKRRERAYRGDRPTPEVRGRTVILIDDGLATGASMRAAIAGLQAQHPAKLVVAVPTGALETCEMFAMEVDEIVCAITPEPFYGVGRWYEDFAQTTDEDVRMLLEAANRQVQIG